MNFLDCFLLAYVFAHNTAAWSFVPGIEQLGTIASIANAAIFYLAGFLCLGRLKYGGLRRQIMEVVFH